MAVISPVAHCAHCGPADEVVTAHFSLRHGWQCFFCSAPALSAAAPWQVVAATAQSIWSRLVFEYRCGQFSKYRVFRWVSALRR